MFPSKKKLEAVAGYSGIYKITLVGTNRHYVGQAHNLAKRWKSHRNEANCVTADGRRKTKILRALAKYGVEQFEFSVLVFCDHSNLNDMEAHFINKFRCCEDGFNIRRFNTGEKPAIATSEETREKLRIANTGKKRSPEMIERMRKAAMEKPPMSKDARRKMSEAQKRGDWRNSPDGQVWMEKRKRELREKMTGKKLPPHWRAALKAGAQKRAKPIQSVEIESGIVVKTYASLSEAVNQGAATSFGNLCACLKGRLQTHNGYKWRYAAPESSVILN